MPVQIGRAGEYGHNNSEKAFVDSNFVRGGVRVVANDAGLTGLTSVSDQLKEYVTIVYHEADSKLYLLVDSSNIATKATGWTDLGDLMGTGSGIENVHEDASPQLGGNLDVFYDGTTRSIVNSNSGSDIQFTPTGTGKINLDGLVEFKRFDHTASPPEAFEGGMYADTADNLYFGVT
jgi:hypothetical protein